MGAHAQSQNPATGCEVSSTARRSGFVLAAFVLWIKIIRPLTQVMKPSGAYEIPGKTFVVSSDGNRDRRISVRTLR